MGTIAIADERLPEAARLRLASEGFDVLLARASRALPAPMAAHPDMLAFYHDETLITSREYAAQEPSFFAELARRAPSLRLIFSDEAPTGQYPRDCIFNALAMGGKLFVKRGSAARSVIDYAAARKMEIVDVRQGYPACTVLPLSEDFALTSDSGMVKALRENGIRAELIENGGIALPPYEYGFIGGAAGRFGDRMYFIGNTARHPDGRRIEGFCREAGLTPVSLYEGELLDLGRIIFIEEGGQKDA